MFRKAKEFNFEAIAKGNVREYIGMNINKFGHIRISKEVIRIINPKKYHYVEFLYDEMEDAIKITMKPKQNTSNERFKLYTGKRDPAKRTKSQALLKLTRAAEEKKPKRYKLIHTGKGWGIFLVDKQ